PSGWTHCIDSPCPGVGRPSGHGLDACQAIHAEQNALLQCADTQAIHTCYCTTSPCVHCTKLLLNTSSHRILFKENYSHARESEALWDKAGRLWFPAPAI